MGRKYEGPGPGKYMLPPCVGYQNHDLRKYRYPQYTIGSRVKTSIRSVGPGPNYDVSKLTEYGLLHPPAYSLKSRHREPNPKAYIPGPGAYKPEQVPPMSGKRPPAYSMKFRHKIPASYTTPGPNKYEIPTTIGPKVPDLHANAAYSLSYRHNLADVMSSPGPARYAPPDTNVYKYKTPKYSIPPRVFPPDTVHAGPGPIYMAKLPKRCSNGYSFGTKHDVEPYITPEDEMPCVSRQKSV